MAIDNLYEDDLLVNSSGKEKKKKKLKHSVAEHWYTAPQPRKREEFLSALDWIVRHYDKEVLTLMCSRGFYDYLDNYIEQPLTTKNYRFQYGGKSIEVVRILNNMDDGWEHARFSCENSHYLIQFI